MKTYFTLLFLTCYVVIHGQKKDSIILKCSYNFTFVPDTNNIAQKGNDLMILEIGNKTSKYYSYYRNIGDSLLKADIEHGRELSEMMLKAKNIIKTNQVL